METDADRQQGQWATRAFTIRASSALDGTEMETMKMAWLSLRLIQASGQTMTASQTRAETMTAATSWPTESFLFKARQLAQDHIARGDFIRFFSYLLFLTFKQLAIFTAGRRHQHPLRPRPT